VASGRQSDWSVTPRSSVATLAATAVWWTAGAAPCSHGARSRRQAFRRKDSRKRLFVPCRYRR